ncbi:MAG: hypothetical protein ACRD59_02680 [Candidatus Acidiferrales bacterium]
MSAFGVTLDTPDGRPGWIARELNRGQETVTTPTRSDALSTAGGVVFGSQDEVFFALDPKTGREIWRVGTGGKIRAGPITYISRGEQRVTIAAGHVIMTFGLDPEARTQSAMGLKAARRGGAGSPHR